MGTRTRGSTVTVADNASLEIVQIFLILPQTEGCHGWMDFPCFDFFEKLCRLTESLCQSTRDLGGTLEPFQLPRADQCCKWACTPHNDKSFPACRAGQVLSKQVIMTCLDYSMVQLCQIKGDVDNRICGGDERGRRNPIYPKSNYGFGQ